MNSITKAITLRDIIAVVFMLAVLRALFGPPSLHMVLAVIASLGAVFILLVVGYLAAAAIDAADRRKRK